MYPSLSDQRWPLASDPLHLPDPGPKLTPHSGCVQPTNNRTWCTLSPRSWACVLPIGPCGGARNTPACRSDWMRGMDRDEWPFRPLFHLYKICLDCRTGGGTRERRPIGNAEIRLLALISLWKTKISSVFRDLFVWYKIWMPLLEVISTSFLSSLGPCCIIFSSRSDTGFCKNLKKFFKRSVQKYGTVTSANAIIPILMLKYYLYMYMYCIL